MLARIDEVQKWHTSSRRMSLRRANCLAKINHAGWRGWSCWRVHTCTDHRSRWPSSSCTPRPPRPASIYVAPGAIYAPSADVYVRPAPAYRQQPYAEPGYGYRQPSYGTRALHIAHRHRSMASTDRPTPRSRPMSNARPSIPSVTTRRSVTTLPSVLRSDTTVRIATTRRNATMRWNTRRGRLCPCPTVRARDATTAMAGGSPAIKAAGIARVRCDCGDNRRMGGAQRYPSPFRARDRWVSLSLYPSYELSAQFPVYPPVGRGPWNWMPHFFAIEACSTATPR